MRFGFVSVLVLLMLTLLVSGCTSGITSSDPAERAKQECIEECQLELNRGTYLEDGPCLTDINSRWNVRDWVCDVAHDPRQDVDNDPKNQCTEYREGEASHFVEVTPDCQLIRAV
jgi:hypothetical protein